MEGLRGAAALMVLMVHFYTLFSEFAPEASPLLSVTHFLASIGNTGVDVFFVLSGYLLYGVMLKKEFRFFPYLYGRAERLYPAFLSVFLLYLALSHLFPQSSKLPEQTPELVRYLAINLLMLPGIVPVLPMITPAWSLSYEWFFYLVGPLFVLVTGMRNRSLRVRIGILMGLASVYLGLCFAVDVRHPRMAMFLGGCLLWECVKGGILLKYLVPAGEWVAVAAFLLNLGFIGWLVSTQGNPVVVVEGYHGYYTGTLFITSYFFVGYALFHRGWLAQLFSLTPLRWIGTISYSYYLIHGAALHGLKLLVRSLTRSTEVQPSNLLFALLFLASLAGTLAAGAALYLLTEKPFLELRAARMEAATAARRTLLSSQPRLRS